jgi:hypothetical protein
MRDGIERRIVAVAVAALCASSLTWVAGQQRTTTEPIALDADDIGGVVTSSKGPEAGVWVIAETKELRTRMIKSVVTDDQGRYVIPDLPTATYEVFVRGYGLVDSPRVRAKVGQRLDLKAVIAPDGKAAAQYYPASYWLSLMEIPKGAHSEQEMVSTVKFCLQCHALGTPWTREVQKSLGTFPSSLAAWDQRVKTGASRALMSASFMKLGPQRQMFSDWTDKIAAGAYPQQPPPRPSGAERNVVITQWDWAWPEGTRADSVASDEAKGTVNANGRVYGVYTNGGKLAWLDPKENAAGAVALGATPEETPGLRSLAIDAQGRVWFTAGRPQGAPDTDFCKPENSKYGKYFPLKGRGKQLVMYDPKTDKVSKIPTCQAVDHNHFGEKEADVPIYFGQNEVVGWFSTATWDKTHDAAASQGWCPAVVDTNGDGKITEWTEPDQPFDPKKDRRLKLSCYSIAVSPVDGSLWCSGIEEEDNQLVRIERGSNPPQSCKAEVYRPPTQSTPFFKTGGVSVDADGVAWIGWRGSDQVTSFDRRKCKVTTGSNDKGDQCPEGWSAHQMTRPLLKGTTHPAEAEMMYLTHVDRHDTLGLGRNAVVSGTVNSDSLQVYVPATGKFLDLVVPYPMGFFSRSSNGRIDQPQQGWKGRGLWSNTSTYTTHHMEGGQGTLPRALKFQMRPNPLAK